ncbi:MAG: hypothetical protein IT215_05960 [Chitinophagaceae bacterium]|nr:hypothetical protein [Chitinophagaceae bacterium]
MNKKTNKKSGQIVIMSILFFIFIASMLIYIFMSPVSNQIKATYSFRTSKQSVYLSESVVEDFLYRLKSNIATSTKGLIINDIVAVPNELGSINQEEISSEAIIDGVSRNIKATFIKTSENSASWKIQNWSQL